ncbi:MAG: hypothetical protein Q9185_000468 [Variospora sp. 1 TL-2023]
MASYLITGASQGVGLELIKQLLEQPAEQVGKIFAVTRSDNSAPLRHLINANPDRVVPIIASVDDSESVQKAADDVKTKLAAYHSSGLDVLVNSAGITAACPGGMRTVPPEQMARIFEVNVIGTQRMIAAFLPLLENGNQKKWLKTNLGGDNADLDVEVGVTELKRIILQSTKAQNGKCLNIHVPGQEEAWGQYDGGEVPW